MIETTGSRPHRSTELLLLVVVFIWAANAPLVKFGLVGLDPLVFNSLRFLVAGIALAALFFARSSWRNVPLKDWYRLTGLALIAHVVYQMAYIFGIKNTTVGNSAIILSTSPLWTVFFNSVIHKEKVPGKAWVGMLVSLSGIVLIVIGTGSTLVLGGDAFLGDVLSLVAALLWALSTTLQRNFLKEYSATQLTVILVGLGAILLTVAAIPSAFILRWGDVDAKFYVAAVCSGAMSIGAATVLWAVGIKNIGPRRTANFNNLVPVLAFVFAYLTLGENMYPLQVLGAAVTLVGVWLARR
ncbi:MAG TPA: DMT family transporter [Bacteroidota bacterium]|nr:DMT family transporter [Bacteroidota bacterium]